MLGAYYSGEEWIPCAWDIDGYIVDKEHPTGLDIIETIER